MRATIQSAADDAEEGCHEPEILLTRAQPVPDVEEDPQPGAV